MASATSTYLQELDEATCRDLFADAEIARIAFRHGHALEIFPINVVMHDDEPYFLTAPGTKLGSAASDAEVLVEADDYDEDERTGWSVIARGRAHMVIDHDDLEPLMALNFEPWADLGRRGQWVRIEVEAWTGRRLSHDEDPE